MPQSDARAAQPASSGRHVRRGIRQSIPSSSIDSCARLSTTNALLGPRPDESATLQALGEQAQPVAIPPQQLDQITAAAAEAKHVTRERILPKHRLRLRRQAVEPLAHVGGARRQPYPGARRQSVHRSSSITCRSVSELTSPRRRTRAPQPNAISMTPSRSGRRGRPSSVDRHQARSRPAPLRRFRPLLSATAAAAI